MAAPSDRQRKPNSYRPDTVWRAAFRPLEMLVLSEPPPEFARIEVECATLQSICREHGVVPDLLKIDIEGMEWDLVRASLDWLAQRRPRMHLEVHPAFIRRQHRDPHVLLKNLQQIGYRSHDGAPWASAFKRANGDANFHLDLVAKV